MTDTERVAEMLGKLYPNREVIDLTAPGWRWRIWRGATRYALLDLKARVIHPLGFHTMIPLEQWDTEAGSIQFDGLVCWVCDRRT